MFRRRSVWGLFGGRVVQAEEDEEGVEGFGWGDRLGEEVGWDGVLDEVIGVFGKRGNGDGKGVEGGCGISGLGKDREVGEGWSGR